MFVWVCTRKSQTFFETKRVTRILIFFLLVTEMEAFAVNTKLTSLDKDIKRSFVTDVRQF